MTLGLKKPAIETILRSYVETNYPGYEVQSMAFTTESTGSSQRDDGYIVFSGVNITLKPKR